MSLYDPERIRARLVKLPDPHRFLEQLFANTPYGLALWDSRGHVVLTNRAFCELFESEPPAEYSVLEDPHLTANGTRPFVERAYAGEAVTVPTFWYDPRDDKRFQITEGRRVAVSLSLFPLLDAAGNVEYVVATYRDDTEVSLQSERLSLELAERKRSDAQRVAVLEAALDAIVMMDESGAITEFNPAAERLFGYGREEVLGRLLASVIIPPALRPLHEAGLERLRETGQGPFLGNRIETTAVRRDGTEFPVEVAIVRTRLLGRSTFTGHIRDITERRRAADAELLQREKDAAQAANRELEAFSYSVAHDLRAPLRGINGFAGVLLEDYADVLNERGRQHLDRIMTGATRMGHIIDSLLALARVSRVGIEFDSTDLVPIARAVIEQLRARDPERNVTFEAPARMLVRGDASLLRTVLENLLGNAWKFTRNQEAARIELGRRVVDADSQFYVRDNGAGFDMRYVNQLFKAFQRLHSNEEFEGTGVGLATVQRVIARHGGKVWAEATPNQGATFFFTLPSQRNE